MKKKLEGSCVKEGVANSVKLSMAKELKTSESPWGWAMEGIGNISKNSVTRVIGSEATLPWMGRCLGVEEVEMVSRNLTTKEEENMIDGDFKPNWSQS